ncbi:MAG TPA: aldehyde dehydrogenase family protein [Steroidobacteraceae bacterium]|jgi:phenylacetaldehyde dehydrogenase|nr:aldehyde dehydrogenase family protein [Steroidobacteraceae bacterium]
MNVQMSFTRSEPLTLVRSFLARTHALFIDGKFVPARSGETFEVINPATGEVFAKASAGAAADIDLAVKAARRAFDSGPWSAMNPSVRRNLMWKLADALEKNGDEIAILETLNNGMPLSMARSMVTGGAECLRYNAGWAGKINGETPTISAPNHHVYTLREPVGVVGAITPWNGPLAMAVAKIAAALAAGCTVVLKPAELTPLTAIRLAELIAEVGFPPGVVNVVTGFGDPAGKALVNHPEVDKISYTGSTVVGKSIVAAAAGNLKRVALELGGKSPVIIFPDADLERATASAAEGIFRNAGQACVAGSRLYVHKKVFDQVVRGVVERAKTLKVGSGIQSDTQMGPLISQKQLDRVSGYVQSGKEQGAEIVVGGKRVEGKGYFMQPTVLAETNRDMRVVQEEIFGPVVCAMPIDNEDLDRIVSVANDTEYGLSSSIWTRDISLAHKLARRIKAGTVRINGGMGLDYAMPFGGYKQSGWGRENAREGVEAYTEVKTVSVAL